MALIDPEMRTDRSPPQSEDEIWNRFDRLVAMRNASKVEPARGLSGKAPLDRAGSTPPFVQIDAAPMRLPRGGRLSAAASGALGGFAALAVTVLAVAAFTVSGPGRHDASAPPLIVAAPPSAPVVASQSAPAVMGVSGDLSRLPAAPPSPDLPADLRQSPAATLARLDERTLRLAQVPPAERAAAPVVRRSAPSAEARVILRASGQVDAGKAVAALKAAGVSEVSMRHSRVSALTVQARFFHRQDRQRAAAVLTALGSPAAPSDFTHLKHRPPRGVVEVLLPTPHDVAMRAGRNSFN